MSLNQISMATEIWQKRGQRLALQLNCLVLQLLNALTTESDIVVPVLRDTLGMEGNVL